MHAIFRVMLLREQAGQTFRRHRDVEETCILHRALQKPMRIICVGCHGCSLGGEKEATAGLEGKHRPGVRE